MDALPFLEKPRLHRLYVVHGDEDLLRRLVLEQIRKTVLGEANDDPLSYSAYQGESAAYAAVMDEVQTPPFLGERRLVVVENGDPFVTRHRAALEKAVNKLPDCGVLVLSVKTWTSTTRLAKMVDAAATISCKAPPPYTLPKWCMRWTASRHQKQLTTPAAELLVALVGPEMGLLDQELIKLAIYVGDRPRIDVDDVDKLVGRGRAEDTWAIFGAIGAGEAKKALEILNRVLDQGDEPIRLLGAFSWQLRKLAQANRLVQQGRTMAVALAEVGVPSFSVNKAEAQLKHIGPRRAGNIYDWLLEADQSVKGGSELPPQTILERLVLRLTKHA